MFIHVLQLPVYMLSKPYNCIYTHTHRNTCMIQLSPGFEHKALPGEVAPGPDEWTCHAVLSAIRTENSLKLSCTAYTCCIAALNMDFLLVFFYTSYHCSAITESKYITKKKKTSEKRAGKGNVQNIGWYQCSVSTYCWSSISSCITSSNLLARLIGRWLTWKSIVAVQKAKKSVNCFLTLESASLVPRLATFRVRER